MATLFLSSPPPSHLLFSKNQINSPIFQKRCNFTGKVSAYCCISSTPTPEFGVCKRDLLLFGLSTSVALILPSPGIGAEEVKMAEFNDDLNAYTYSYPVELPSKKVIFKWVESRKPERYSSAAPLSPNARLRIVSERVDFIDNLIISVTRVTSTQKLAESSILDAHADEVDGERYWFYEYLVRKSPTKSAQESNNYRQYVASTAERDGFLYTLNASTLTKQWAVMGPILKSTVDSFRLLPPTDNYVPPYKDPWRFW